MADIENIEKHISNTFYVNPEGYNETAGAVDPMGVSLQDAVYTEGIEMPDKIVTVNGDINYHLIDAPNIDWDNVNIPWAKRITKWGGAGTKSATQEDVDAGRADEINETIPVNASDMYSPSYKYNKPSGSWETGYVNESEEVADILNYLIYRVISLDYFMDHFDERNLSSSVLRLTNYRTDWYSSLGSVSPDDLDGNDDSSTENIKDDLISVAGTITAFLYPSLVANSWTYDGTTINFYSSASTSSTKVPITGVLISDLGYAATRAITMNGNAEPYYIKSGYENFDIYRVTTKSTSKDITFTKDLISGHNYLFDGWINTDTYITETSSTEVTFKFTLPLVAFKCNNSETYTYEANQIIFDIIAKHNYESVFVGSVIDVSSPSYAVATQAMENNNTTITCIDADVASTGFHINIARSNDNPGYASEQLDYSLNIYKGENSISEFYLEGKSTTISKIRSTGRLSTGTTVNLYACNTYLTLPKVDADAEYGATNLSNYKAKIIFKSEFGQEYDDSVTDTLNKSHIMPYLYIKPDTTLTETNAAAIMTECCVESAFEELHIKDKTQLQVYTAASPLVLFDNYNDNTNNIHYNFGKITYEYDSTTDTFDYWYTAPSSKAVATNTLGTVTSDGELNINLYLFLYYPYGDSTTNRLLKPVMTVLPITLKPILKNQILFFDGKTTKTNSSGVEITNRLSNYINAETTSTGETYYTTDTTPAGFDYAIWDKDSSGNCIKYSSTLNSGINILSNTFVRNGDSIATSKYTDNVSVSLKGYVLPDKTTRTINKNSVVGTSWYENYKDYTFGRSRININEQDTLEMTMTTKKVIVDSTYGVYDDLTDTWTINGKTYLNDEDNNAYYEADVPNIIYFENTGDEVINTVATTLYNVKDIVDCEGDTAKLNDLEQITLSNYDKSQYASVSNNTTIQFYGSTVLFPEENGILSTTKNYDYLFDADIDAFWLAFEITCPDHLTATSTDTAVYEGCSGWYFVKLIRGNYNNLNLQFNNDITKYTFNSTDWNTNALVRNDIYLDLLLNTTSKTALTEFTGKQKWVAGDTTVDGSKFLDKQYVHIYNIGDEWPYRSVRENTVKATSNTNGIIEDSERIDWPTPNNQTTNYLDSIPGATAIITSNGEWLENTDGTNTTVRSLGTILSVEKLITTTNDIVQAAQVDISLKYAIGNDFKYNKIEDSGSVGMSISINKREYDIILAILNSGGSIIKLKYDYTEGVTSDVNAQNHITISGTTDTMDSGTMTNEVKVYFISNELQDFITGKIADDYLTYADYIDIDALVTSGIISSFSVQGDGDIKYVNYVNTMIYPAYPSAGDEIKYIIAKWQGQQYMHIIGNKNFDSSTYAYGDTTVEITIGRNAIYKSKTIFLRIKHE